jgi:uncharacterized membrane protein
MNPILGVIIAAIVLSEKITTPDIIGVIVIMTAIIMIQSSQIKN